MTEHEQSDGVFGVLVAGAAFVLWLLMTSAIALVGYAVLLWAWRTVTR